MAMGAQLGGTGREGARDAGSPIYSGWEQMVPSHFSLREVAHQLPTNMGVQQLLQLCVLSLSSSHRHPG